MGAHCGKHTYTFAGDVALALHAGHQKIKNFSLLSYTDYKIEYQQASRRVLGYYASRPMQQINPVLPRQDTNGDDKKLCNGVLL